jgi:hypothetical protein
MAIARWPFFSQIGHGLSAGYCVSFHDLHFASALVLSVLSQRRHTFARIHPWRIAANLFDVGFDAANLKISLCVLAHGTSRQKQG